MYSFKQSCVTSLERLALKIDSKQISVTKTEQIDNQDLRQKLETLKNEQRPVKDTETALMSYLLAIHADQKQIYHWLDALKFAYVVDNTRMIELDEMCVKQRHMIKQAQTRLAAGQTIADRIRNLKETVATKVLQLKISSAPFTFF